MTTLERARFEVSECKRRCREAFELQGDWHPVHIFWQCHEYHRLVGVLRMAEAQLRVAEAQAPANDASAEVA